MPAKSFLMAFVLSGWLIALVVAGLIVAYTSFFGMTPAQQRVFRAEQALEAQSTRLFRYGAMAMVLVGSVGFWFFQM